MGQSHCPRYLPLPRSFRSEVAYRLTESYGEPKIGEYSRTTGGLSRKTSEVNKNFFCFAPNRLARCSVRDSIQSTDYADCTDPKRNKIRAKLCLFQVTLNS